MRDRLPSAPAHLVVDRVEPVVDGGRYPVKRLVGDEVTVQAIVFRDGHDLIAARVRFRGPGEKRWRRAPMAYERDFDRCTGSFVVDRIGTWQFSVEAWTDRFGTWRADLAKRLAARQELDEDLRAGAEMLRTASRRARREGRATLKELADLLDDTDVSPSDRAERAVAADVAALAVEHLPPTDLTAASRDFEIVVDRERAGCGAWYEMFPRSQAGERDRHGTWADATEQLPRLASLGFDVIYLPPIHPIGRTNRKGRNNTLVPGPDDPGSPWAIGNEHGGHTAVEPALGTLAEFEAFVGAAREHGLEIALDYALQCSPDHPWVREHPDWFFVRADGSIKYAENPPKKYEDIVPLNFWCDDWQALWQECREVLTFWIEHGVRIFRVDNPHTKPFAFWEWLLGSLRREHPDLIFLSEAFTRPARMKGLAKLGFTQSYTYFTWRNTAWELREYLTELTKTSMVEYFRPNFFANTPDILHEYLQQGGRPAFRTRLVLAATLSPVYGIYSGFELCERTAVRQGSEEYRDSEKYQLRTRQWDAPGNINADIVTLNAMRRENAALQRFANLEFLGSENDAVLAYWKHAPESDLLIVVNLDPHQAQATMVHVPVASLGLGEDEPFRVEDLLTGSQFVWRGTRNYVRLDPAEQVAHILRVIRIPEERDQVE